MDNVIGYKTILGEVIRSFERQLASFDDLKVSSRTTLTASSIIFALASFLQYNQLHIAEPANTILKLVIAVLYLAVIVLSIFVSSPMEYYAPVKADWDVLTKAFYNKDEEEVLRMQISATLDVIKLNRPMVTKQRLLVTISNILLVLLLVVMALSPIFSK